MNYRKQQHKQQPHRNILAS